MVHMCTVHAMVTLYNLFLLVKNTHITLFDINPNTSFIEDFINAIVLIFVHWCSNALLCNRDGVLQQKCN